MPRGQVIAWRHRSERMLAWVLTAVAVSALYVAVVLFGALVTGEARPSFPLTVLATVVVAAVIGPVQRRNEKLTARLAHHDPRPPADALRRFTRQVGAGQDVGELPQRMARLLAEGTATAWAQVWVLVHGRLTLMATHPPEADAPREPPLLAAPPTTGTGIRSVTVGHEGRPLGVLRVQERPGHGLTLTEERLFAGLAAQAGLALHAAQLRAELVHRRDELSRQEAELRASRDDLVSTQDRERRKLERDIHDGAQQQLVALGVNLRLAQTLADRPSEQGPERARQLLLDQGAAAAAALETLTSLSRGVLPDVLRRHGLVAALRQAAESSPVPVVVSGDLGVAGGPEAEAALYFCGLEAIQNAVKHARASLIEVRVEEVAGEVRLSVTDDGRGLTASDEPGTGLHNMRQRLSALGGSLRVGPDAGRGTRVEVSVPAPAGGPT